MNVFYVIPPGYSPDHPTAAGVHMREIIEGLRRLGATVRTVQTEPVPQEELGRPAAAPRRRGFLPPLIGRAATEARRFVASYTLARKGVRLARHGRPDVIYERADYLWFAGWLLARWLRVPRVAEVNGLYSDVEQFGVRPASRVLARWAQVVKARGAERIVAISREMKKGLVQIGVPQGKIVVHHNGVRKASRVVDPDAVTALRGRLGLEGRTVCGFVGYVLPWHGIDVLIRAAAKVREVADVRLLIVGAGQIIPNLVELARRLGLSRNVLFVGPVPHEQIPVYLACMDICTIPRHGPRNMPVKLFEYGMAGKPIIAAITPAILEVWQPGVHGIGIRNGHVDDLAEAIRRYVENPALRAQHGRAFQRKVMSEHTWTQVARRTFTLLSKVIDEHEKEDSPTR